MLTMLNEGHTHEVGEVNRGTALFRLQRHERTVTADGFESALDADRAFIQIDLRPLQTQHLAESQPDRQADGDNRRQSRALDAREKHRRMIRGQDRPLPARRLRPFHERGDVSRRSAIRDRLIQSDAQHSRVVRIAEDVIRSAPRQAETEYLIDALQAECRQHAIELTRAQAVVALATSQREVSA